MNTLGSSGLKATQTTGRITEKGAVGLFRWVSTDHTGFSESLRHIPPMGAADTFKYILMQFLLAAVFVPSIALLLPGLFAYHWKISSG